MTIGAITRAEFGIGLFDAVRCIGILSAVQGQINAAVHRQVPIESLVQRRDAVKKELIEYMKNLDESDVAEIARRFPVVAMM